MSWPRPEDNHVGGWIGFGPKDGYLYIDSGDGGNWATTVAAVISNRAATPKTSPICPNAFMGKQLRIDVHGDDFPAMRIKTTRSRRRIRSWAKPAQDEIWAYGLRNPYRASFDRDTGDLWIGDVGQDTREEIDKQPALEHWRSRTTAGDSGRKYPDACRRYRRAPRRRLRAARLRLRPHGTSTGVDFSGNAVIGGYVYRGPDPSLQGTYFFADEGSSHRVGNESAQRLRSPISIAC